MPTFAHVKGNILIFARSESLCLSNVLLSGTGYEDEMEVDGGALREPAVELQLQQAASFELVRNLVGQILLRDHGRRFSFACHTMVEQGFEATS